MRITESQLRRIVRKVIAEAAQGPHSLVFTTLSQKEKEDFFGDEVANYHYGDWSEFDCRLAAPFDSYYTEHFPSALVHKFQNKAAKEYRDYFGVTEESEYEMDHDGYSEQAQDSWDRHGNAHAGIMRDLMKGGAINRADAEEIAYGILRGDY